MEDVSHLFETGRPVEFGDYVVDGPLAHDKGLPETECRLDLVMGDLAYYLSDEADEVHDALLFQLKDGRLSRLADAGFLASDSYQTDCDKLARGARADYAGPAALAYASVSNELHPTLYDSDDYTDVDEFMDRYREDFGEDIAEEQAWELLGEQSREDLKWVVEDVDALLSRENPGGALMVRGTQRRWDGPSSGFSDPYGSFASLMGDTGHDGLFKDCDAFRVYVGDGSLFAEGVHHDGAVSVEVRALSAEQMDGFDGAAEAFICGHPEPMEELWEQASRIDVRQGGLSLVPPGEAPSAQEAFERALSAAASSSAGASPARARSI